MVVADWFLTDHPKGTRCSLTWWLNKHDVNFYIVSLPCTYSTSVKMNKSNTLPSRRQNSGVEVKPLKRRHRPLSLWRNSCAMATFLGIAIINDSGLREAMYIKC